MKTKAAIASGLVILGGVFIVITTSCGDDAQETVEAARLARKGEACQSTADCAPGLACLPASVGGGQCVLGAFTVAQTAKECALIECTVGADCCGPPPSNCQSLLESCAQLQDAGAQPPIQACINYQNQCVCDGSKRDCEQGKCVVKCANDTECGSGVNRLCAGGKCVQCGKDSDCGSSGQFQCVNGSCKGPCEGDGDCPGFERCLAGKCTPGACQTNRECIAATRNVEATCGTDGKCIVPCTTDLECGNPKNFRFFSCVNNQCLYLGCESDKDCRLLLEGAIGSSSGTSGTSGTSGSSGGSSGSSKTHIVCREKQPGTTSTLPAQ